MKIYISYNGDEVEIGEVKYGAARIDPDSVSRRIEEIVDDLVGDFSANTSVTISLE